jgi:M6 family metalloprotease-like protein
MFRPQLWVLVSLLLLGISISLSGIYVDNQPLALTQPDGSKPALFSSGDEYYNWVHDANNFTVLQNDKGWYVYAMLSGEKLYPTDFVVGRDNPADRGLVPGLNIPVTAMNARRQARYDQIRSIGGDRTPHSGTLNNIVIFIRFSDQAEFTQNISTYSAMFNGTTGNTMQSYFLEASYNALNISTSFYPSPSTTVLSWQDSQPRGYYSPYNATTNTIGYQDDSAATTREHTLLVNAVAGVRSGISSGLNIDADNDGYVDNVCFIIQGANDAWAELLWPHRWSLWSQSVYINNKRVYDYNFQLSDFLAGSGNGVLAHEMFHSLGSPDLYHYTSNGISPAGSWDLMCSNTNPPQHMSAYMKYRYVGWISSIPTISTAGSYTLSPLTSSSNNCYRINSPNSTSEYFVVEYRQKTGTFENSLPGSGLIFWRINSAYSGNGNASGPPDEVYLYRPNGTATVNGDTGNAYFSEESGRNLFNNYTNPNPFLNSGSTGNINIAGIGSSAGSTMTFSLSTADPLSQVNQGFESGIPTGWTNSGNANWAADNTTYFSGAYSLKSGDISSSQSTVIQSSTLNTNAGQVSFFYKISSEANYDYLKFYIDNTLKGQWSGEGNWAMVAYNVAAGSHTFKWEYMKDGSVDTGSDCAWIDHIGYPEVGFSPPQNLIASAGNYAISLSWTAPLSGSPASYKVFRNGNFLASSTALSYYDNTVANGIAYSYYVTAVYTSPAGESAASNTATATPTDQVSLTLGTGTVIGQSLPIEPYYGYTYSQSIYLQSEINQPNKLISKVAWYYNGNSTWTDALQIYMGHTALTAFANTSSWIPLSELTLVYNGNIAAPAAAGWIELTLNTPFAYNNSQNLVIAVDENTNGYHSNSDEFYLTVTPTARSLVYYNDYTNPSPAAPPTTGSYLYLKNYIPNVRLGLQDPPVYPAFGITPSALDFGINGVNTTTSRSVTVTNTGTGSLMISAINIDNSIFSLAGLPLLTHNLNAGQAFTFTVSFSPTAIQTYSANLTVTDNLSRIIHSIPLTGSAADPTITAFPWTESFDTFPPAFWNQSGGTQQWTQYAISNPANNVAKANLWSWTVPNNAVLISPPLRPALLCKLSFRWSHIYHASYPADTLKVYYSTNQTTWTPIWSLGNTAFDSADGAGNTTPGSFVTAEVSLPAGHNTTSFYIKFDAISGYGPDLFIDDVSIIPLQSIVISPSVYNYGEVAIGTSVTQNMSIQNIGGYPLTGTVNASNGFSASLSRSSSERNVISFSVPAYQTLNVPITFTPTEARTYGVYVIINNNDTAHATKLIRFSGTGYFGANLVINTPAQSVSLPFGNTENSTLTLQNTGGRALTYTISTSETTNRDAGELSSAGNRSRDVSWLSVSPVEGTININQSQVISLGINTQNTTPGLHQAILTISSNDPLQPIRQATVDINVSLNTPDVRLSNLSGNRILTWTAIPGANNYQIYRSLDNLSFELIGSTVLPQYQDSSSLIQAFYRIVAVYQ